MKFLILSFLILFNSKIRFPKKKSFYSIILQRYMYINQPGGKWGNDLMNSSSVFIADEIQINCFEI